MQLDTAKVRWHRDRLGWTLDTLAEQAEVAEGTVLRAEHGEDIRPSSGRRIARALGVDISELVPEKPGVVLPKGPAPSPLEEERRPTIIDVALDAARRQVALERQVMRQAMSGDRAREGEAVDLDQRHANEAMRRLREEYALDGNDAEALVDFALKHVYLEDDAAALRNRLQEREQAHS